MIKDMTKGNIQILKGFRDFAPEEAEARQKVFETIRSVFERYGFLPLETPALEYKEVLAGKYGVEGEKLMYDFKDKGGREVALRYDLTVPLARFFAQNQNELPLPFKRYQIAPVWRAENPQRGRYREFYQCDIDVAGSDSLFADAEVIACLNAVMEELGLLDVVIRINNRKLLDGIVKESGIAAKKSIEVIRVLDKLDKIGEEKVRAELKKLGAGQKEIDKLFEYLNQDFQDSKDFVARFEGIDGAGELAEVFDALLDMGIKNYQIDLTLARGLDYYTGTIFEFVLPDAAEVGSVVGGGRYDDLIGKLSGKKIPAVGGSIGIDRLIAALEELELIKYDLVSDVLVCNLDENLTEEYLRIVQDLRKAGIKTDFYYEPAKLDKQLKYADKKNINYAVIIGTDEETRDEATVKNMTTGKQEKVKQKDLIEVLKSK